MTDRDIPEEMVEKGAASIDDLLAMLGVEPGEWQEHGGPTTAEVLARAVLSAALAGRQVVDLPEPVRAEPGEDAVVWRVGKLDVEAWRGEVSLMWGIDGDGGDGRDLTATAARDLAAALLAAADEHERLASGSGVGDQP